MAIVDKIFVLTFHPCNNGWKVSFHVLHNEKKVAWLGPAIEEFLRFSEARSKETAVVTTRKQAIEYFSSLLYDFEIRWSDEK